jgi:hypothetical protein
MKNFFVAQISFKIQLWADKEKKNENKENY